MAGDKVHAKQASPPLSTTSSSSSSAAAATAAGYGKPVSDNSSETKRWVQSTSLQPLKPVNRRTDDVTVTSPAPSSSSSPLPAVNVSQRRAIFESSQ